MNRDRSWLEAEAAAERAELHLSRGEPYRSLAAYAQALALCADPAAPTTWLKGLERRDTAVDSAQGREWGRRLLLLGLAVRFPTEDRLKAVRRMATEGAPPIRPPVLVIAGGTDAAVEERIRHYRPLLIAAMTRFEGTLVSGGTTQGVSGLAGDVAQAGTGRIHAVGYLPERIPPGATRDLDPRRYTEIRTTEGSDFTPLQPLQAWADLVASGVRPGEVRVLGINGGAVAGAEYRIALGLGATVGLLQDSGREADRFLEEAGWTESERLLELTADPGVVAAFAAGSAGRRRPRERAQTSAAETNSPDHPRGSEAHP